MNPTALDILLLCAVAGIIAFGIVGWLHEQREKNREKLKKRWLLNRKKKEEWLRENPGLTLELPYGQWLVRLEFKAYMDLMHAQKETTAEDDRIYQELMASVDGNCAAADPIESQR